MGYTHYFELNSKPSEDEIIEYMAVVKKLIDTSEVAIVGGHGEPDTKPLIDKDDGIYFNGLDDDSHETFNIDFNSTDRDFCKTARKPYDEVVVACLIKADEMLNFQWSSDGDDEDFDSARKLIDSARV